MAELLNLLLSKDGGASVDLRLREILGPLKPFDFPEVLDDTEDVPGLELKRFWEGRIKIDTITFDSNLNT